ncbi:MAG TPA: 4Fe-4S binding protein [Ruminiclostridium sp.]|nr:4Fe-4S binding protein [Ruminiclostridium sp.]
MKRQRIRKTILLFSMLLFPVTLNYLSPFVSIVGGFAGIVSGSAIFFLTLFLFSLFFGRAYCGWVCPAGALQDCCSQINGKAVSRKQSVIKYFIWVPWFTALISGFITAGGIKKVNPVFLTDHGVSASSLGGLIIYLSVIMIIVLIAMVFGKRSFCHSICWMAPFMVFGSKIKNKLGYPSLQMNADSSACVNCKKCDSNCPMSIDVSGTVKSGNKRINNSECILCGMCADVCPKKVLKMSVR